MFRWTLQPEAPLFMSMGSELMTVTAMRHMQGGTRPMAMVTLIPTSITNKVTIISYKLMILQNLLSPGYGYTKPGYGYNSLYGHSAPHHGLGHPGGHHAGVAHHGLGVAPHGVGHLGVAHHGVAHHGAPHHVPAGYGAGYGAPQPFVGSGFR